MMSKHDLRVWLQCFRSSVLRLRLAPWASVLVGDLSEPSAAMFLPAHYLYVNNFAFFDVSAMIT
jgi:hypothetical protein